MVDEWGVPPAAPGALVDAELWERTSDGYLFRNWAEYQPRKEDVDAERAASRERMRELRARRKQPKPQDSGDSEGVFGRTRTNRSESVRNPDPTHPDPTQEAKASFEGTQQAAAKTTKATGHRLPDDWEPTQALRDAMDAECPGVDQWAQFVRFKDYWAAQAGAKGRKADWDATYRNWIRKAAEDTPRTRQQMATGSARAQQAVQAGLELERMMGLGDQGDRAIAWQGSADR
jgi:hypothetical protein